MPTSSCGRAQAKHHTQHTEHLEEPAQGPQRSAGNSGLQQQLARLHAIAFSFPPLFSFCETANELTEFCDKTNAFWAEELSMQPDS